MLVQVNAPPVAVAGTDARLPVGEVLRLDGGSSYDIDGALRIMPGTSATAPPRRGARSSMPSTGRNYRVGLEVRDDADVANSVGRAGLRVVVNDPPVASRRT